MKVLYYDCFCGISGDMNLGALVDLGVAEEYLIQELAKLQLGAEYELRIQKGKKMGITGTKVDVILRHPLGHSHVAQQPHTGRVHIDDNPQHSHLHDPTSRNLQTITQIIMESSLKETVKQLSLGMFTKIAEAEAKVHGKPVDEVHFHEVGAIDSIVDIVGSAIAIDYLEVDWIMASPVQVGGGFVKCAHGSLPVPAPATAELLKGIPIKSGLVPFETTTPTGAAILATTVNQFTEEVAFCIEKIGYGLGNRDLEIPNALRVFFGERL